jgi:hypothetical protein
MLTAFSANWQAPALGWRINSLQVFARINTIIDQAVYKLTGCGLSG